MKKVLIILIAIAGIYGVIEACHEDSSAAVSHNHDSAYVADGYGYNYSYNNSSDGYTYCNFCNGLGEVSCDVCYGLGYQTIDVPNYGGDYQPDKKVDCSRCFQGDMDCPYC